MMHPRFVPCLRSLGSSPLAHGTAGRSALAVIALVVLAWGAPATAHAHEVYAGLVPNPVTAVNTEGRVRPCINCHNNPDGGAGCGMMPCLNPFGLAFRANMFRWNAALAMMDSDGDGFTNGQELQDPFGSWIDGPYPGVASLVTAPGNPAFTPGDMDRDGDGYCAFGHDANMDGDCRDAGENDGAFDCNEMAAAVHSSATEVCSNVGDDDCDGATTLLDTECSMVVDRDGDGRCPMGTDMNGDRNCAGTGESSASIVDCDDTRANVYAGARENCADTVDNDCDAAIDLADGQCQGDADIDGDGYCPVGRDDNGDGDCVDAGEVVTSIGDCDDENAAINPDATESSALLCGDGLDNECDGTADLNDSACRPFRDQDFDGFCPIGRDLDGDGDCTGGPDLGESGDCDDGNSLRNPALSENCTETEGVDEDCDGAVNLMDIGADGRAESTCLGFVDRDRDGYCFVGPDRNRDGDCLDATEFGFSSDCDESSVVATMVNPTATEVCFDAVDNDCDGSTDASDPTCAAYRDADRDGVCVTGRDLSGDGDCADADEQTADVDAAPEDPTIWPGAPENCVDRKDNDQDGDIDLADGDCTGNADLDGDGYCAYGSDGNGDGDCLDEDEDNEVSDCDDSTVDVGPTAMEICGNFRDDDCDLDVDLFDRACFYLLDRDRDGFCGRGVDDNRDGDCTDEAEDRFGEDCDDTLPEVNPNAMELCDNSRDDDCDGAVDGSDTQCSCSTDADCDDGDPCTIDTCRTAGRGCGYERALSCIDTGAPPDAGTSDAGAPPGGGGCSAGRASGGLGWLLGVLALLVWRRRPRGGLGMMERSSRRGGAVVSATAGLLLVLASPSVASAYATYADATPGVPNADVLGCITCHLYPGGGDDPTSNCEDPGVPCLNPFGTAFAANAYTWNATLAAGNADGDQWTNGQELLDVNGDWVTVGASSYSTLPGFTTAWCGTYADACHMNDCVLNYDDCDTSPVASCTDTNPTFTCTCPSGYSGTGRGSSGCADVNECTGSNYCLEDTLGYGNSCTNYGGGFSCNCNTPEFYLSGSEPFGERCFDTNECTAGNPCLEDTVAGNSCTNSTGRFDCTCGAAGYAISNNGGYPEACVDINECAAGNPCNEDVVGSPNGCTNLTPRYDCSCGAGYTLTGNGTFSEACADVNECMTMPGVCGVGTCGNTTGSYTCSCPGGYSAPPTGGTCSDINECSMMGICGVGSCTNSAGSYTCTCPMGYTFNGTTCVVNNACTAGLDDCDPNATCMPMGSMAWTCACLPGFSGNGYTPPPATDTGCTDVNECVTMPGVCGVGTCRNASGTYLCSCPSGYTAPATGGTCTDVNECVTMPGVCGVGSCTNTAGAYRCTCPAGYSAPGTGGTCSDIDECRTTSTCNAASGWGSCNNTVGGYTCICAAGFAVTGSGLSATCTNVNECSTAPPCGVGTCSDTVGSYTCTCPVGYTAPPSAGTCDDVDECLDPAVCSSGIGYGACNNTDGAFTCSCNPGFELTGSGRAIDCVNVDECARGTDACDTNAGCADGVPAFGADPYVCTCNVGWQGSGFICTDFDECSDPAANDCSPLATCDNQVGTYGCTCNPGYEGNGFECVDVDECGRTPAPCAENETCINQLGAAPLCECRPGFARPEGGGPCVTACGNGLRVIGEECDDGNTTDGDGCSSSCEVEAGWVCFEDPTASVCSYTCGDGVLDPLSGEECDEGTANSDTEPDACRERCVAAACGDGVVDDGEECDEGAMNSASRRDGCRLDCRAAFCGDGVLDEGEYCDRTTVAGDGGGFVAQPIETCTVACLPDAGPVDASVGDAGIPPATGGCGCRASGARPSGMLALFALLGFALARRRR